MRKILFTTPVCPYSRTSGAEVRSAALLEALDRVGEVHVVQTYQYGDRLQAIVDVTFKRPKIMLTIKEIRNPLLRYQPRVDTTLAVERCLDIRVDSFTHVVSRYIWGAFQFSLRPGTKRVADLDDCVFRYAAPDLVTGLSQWTLARFKKRQRERVEQWYAGKLDGAFVVSRRDLGYARRIPVALLENVYGVKRAESGPGQARCLFVGTLTYQPNLEGIQWFLRRCWLRVKERLPHATLTIAGEAPEDFMRWANGLPGVRAIGFVDSLDTVYSEADVVVAPILSGGGAIVKILEAIAFCRPVVATRFAADGYRGSLVPGAHLVACRTSNEFVDSVVRCCEDQVFSARMADDARTVLSASFNQPAFNHAVSALLDRVDGSDAT